MKVGQTVAVPLLAVAGCCCFEPVAPRRREGWSCSNPTLEPSSDINAADWASERKEALCF